MTAALLMLAAWAIEAAFGWPGWLYRRVRHPVVWFGALIGWFERGLNRPGFPHWVRYLCGALASLLAIALATALALLVAHALSDSWMGFAIQAAIASSLLASRSLYQHVASVAAPLLASDLCAARKAVSLIVGRDPAQLDKAGIARASIESLAENASDGVIAPLFWGAIFGLPGIAAYKAINTLDSVIGHRNERHAAFGGFAARLDDVANIVPARLTGLLIGIASAELSAHRIMVRDAKRHRSPNAGWPEAAMAGALGVRLSGPRLYGDRRSEEPWLNPDARDPGSVDIRRALRLYILALMGAALLLTGFALMQEGL
ncbi:adenosylcobinamide-phosphate synthase CbiB [Henriciella litoralis]|uniref:adenosylcobinamide-phosphate synthase CbiB n=1 Tax=Henriciella litoralis TaxID=568102 RepID=UPI001F40DCA3|nr:adenosylcobinamide-phosphate synthase CbiB [Henriciella litoralis]